MATGSQQPPPRGPIPVNPAGSQAPPPPQPAPYAGSTSYQPVQYAQAQAPPPSTVGPVGQLTSALTDVTSSILFAAKNVLDQSAGQPQPQPHAHAGHVAMPGPPAHHPVAAELHPPPLQQHYQYHHGAAQPGPMQPPMAMAHMAAPHASMAGPGHQQAAGPVTSDDRWAVLWTALRVYYCLDAGVAFVLALLGLVFTLATRGASAPACANPYLAISLLIFGTRLLDVMQGASSLCLCGGARGPAPPPLPGHPRPKDTIGQSIRTNIAVCVTQLVLAAAQLVLGVAGVAGGLGECPGAGPVLACVFAVLLGLNAGEELCVWGSALALHRQQDQLPLPGWVDSCIPACIWEYARRTTRA